MTCWRFFWPNEPGKPSSSHGMTETRAPVRSNKNQLFFPGSGVLRDQFLEFLGRNRLAEQIALKGMAAVQIEELMLRLGFHTLGDDIQPERAPQGDDGLHDGCIVGVGGKIADEGLVNLQLVQRS